MDINTLPNVFISYVSENLDCVRRLSEDLAKQGVAVWLDRDQIYPGLRWKDAIRRAIHKGGFFIACFSNEYTRRKKTYMNEELTLAIEELRQYPKTQVWFIPVRLSECEIPDISVGAGELIRDIQWVDLFKDWKGGIERIVSVVKPVQDDIKALLNALQSNDIEIRKRAIEGLVEANTQVAETKLIDVASSSNDPLREMAITALGKIGGPKSASVLATIANKEEHGIAVSTVSALENLGPYGFPHLIHVAKSGTIRARRAAIRALTHFTARSDVIDTLQLALDDVEQINRISAIRAIASYEANETESLLLSALKNKDRLTRYEAAKSLLFMGIFDNTTAKNLSLSCHGLNGKFPGRIPSDISVFRKITSLREAAVPPLIHLHEHGEREQQFAAGLLLRAIGQDNVPEKIWREVNHLPDLDYTDYSIPG